MFMLGMALELKDMPVFNFLVQRCRVHYVGDLAQFRSESRSDPS
jgi:hypothetical protein